MQAVSRHLEVPPTTLREHDAEQAAKPVPTQREIVQEIARRRFSDPDVYGPQWSSYSLVLDNLVELTLEYRSTSVTDHERRLYAIERTISGIRSATFFLIEGLSFEAIDQDVNAAVAQLT